MGDSERQPPCNLEAEESLLGAVMLSTHALDHAADSHLTGSDFYRASHGLIWDTAVQLYSENLPCDGIAIIDRLDQQGDLGKVASGNTSGEERIREIWSLAIVVSSAGHWARIIRDMATLRALITAGSEITALGWERGDDTRVLLDRAEGIVFDLAQTRPSQDFVTVRETVRESYDRIQDAYENGKTAVTGLPAGFGYFDHLTSGLQAGNLIVVAARPSMGKTAFALAVAANVGIRQERPVVVFTMEMSRAEVTDRLLSQEAHIESTKIRNGRLDSDEWKRLIRATALIETAPIVIDDSAMLTAMELRSKARKAKLRYPDLALVVVDYIQLMTSGTKVDNRVQDVSMISRTMKVLARELNVPVLALSQLSRQVESRHDKRPMLSDLRESGGIEQDADLVAFIYRDEYYNPDETDQEGIAELILAKHRNGPVGTVKLAFVKRYVRFSDLPN